MSFPPSAPQQPGQQPNGSQAPQQPQFAQPHQPQVPQPQMPQPSAAPAAPQQPQAHQQPQAPQFQTPATARTTLPTTLALTNTYALVSIILVFIAPLAGIIFGHLGLSQIKRNNDSGRGLALTAVILGYISIGFILLFIIFYVSMIGLLIASAGAAFESSSNFDSF